MPRHYKGNEQLKGAGIQVAWTPELMAEMVKCKNDPIYFAETYMKIVTGDGLVPFNMRSYQKELMLSFVNNRFSIALMARQSGKTETFRAFIIHYILFNPFKTVALLADKAETAQEILEKLQISYMNLPSWLQQGVTTFNKRKFVLENGSRVISSATGPKAARGYTVHCLVIDECAHCEHWDEFYASVYPTISEFKESKIIMSSTPFGLNHFYKFWEESKQGKNEFKRHFVTWDMVPGRDEVWRKNALESLGNDFEKFDQEFCCSFLGSSGTLIGGWKLKQMVSQTPLYQHDGLFQYQLPEEKRKYAMSCDVSHGKGLDYSAFHVIDVTEMPYRQVCVFHSNRITPTDYAKIIYSTAMNYNEALLLIEVNDIGAQVAEIVQWDHGYENIVMTATEGNKKVVVSGWGGRQAIIDKGVRTTLPLKNIGCALIKLLIEQDKLIINHEKTIVEFATFSKKNKSYEAEEGKHDDLVMALVLFAWLSGQQYFKEFTDLDPLAFLRDKTDEELLEELLPFGFIDRGTSPEYQPPTDARPPVRDLTAELLRTFDFDVEIVPGPSWLR